jgi:hypothetical protein
VKKNTTKCINISRSRDVSISPFLAIELFGPYTKVQQMIKQAGFHSHFGCLEEKELEKRDIIQCVISLKVPAGIFS